MNLEIFIDCCAFDQLCKNNVDLRTEFPEETVCFKITKAVKGEIEDIPNDNPDKKHVKTYALKIIESSQVEVTSFFGFDEGGRLWSGFDEGQFASQEQVDFLGATKNKLGSPRKSGLPKNAADIDMIAQAFKKIILTAESSIGSGVSKEPHRAKIINIKDYERNSLSLRNFILTELRIDKSNTKT